MKVLLSKHWHRYIHWASAAALPIALLESGHSWIACLFFALLLLLSSTAYAAIAAILLAVSSSITSILNAPGLATTTSFLLPSAGLVLCITRRQLPRDAYDHLHSKYTRLYPSAALPLSALAFLLAWFRPFPLFEMILWSAVLAGTSLQAISFTQQECRLCHTRLPSILVNWFVFIISSAICLVLMEGAVRLMFPERPVLEAIYEYHVRDLYRMRAGIDFSVPVRTDKDAYESVHFKISSQGFRDREFGPKMANEHRIAMLGDSFTMGMAVQSDHTIPRELEEQLAQRGVVATVMNCGMNGAGPHQELGILIDRVLPLNPDMVILQIFMGNDIANCLQVIGKKLKAYNPLWEDRVSRIREGARLSGKAEAWFTTHVRLYAELKALSQGQTYLKNALDLCRFFPPPRIADSVSNSLRSPLLEANLKDWYPTLKEGDKLLVQSIANIKEECDKRRIPLLGYAIPAYPIVDLECWEELTDHDSLRGQYEWAKAYRHVYAVFDQLGIPTIDMLDVLLKSGAAHDLYYKYDGHLTPVGNRSAGSAIAAFLIEEYWNNSGTEAPREDLDAKTEEETW